MLTMKRWAFLLSVPLIVITVFLLIPLLHPSTKTVSKTLVNCGIFIDPGHGGYDPGSSRDAVLEKDINMKIGGELFEEVLSVGAIAFLTRSEDYDLSRPDSANHKAEDLKRRVESINNSGASLLISLHLNAMHDESVHGPMVYYREKDPVSKKFAESVQNELNELSGLNKIIHGERYYLFRHTKIPAILIECGFLSNSIERRKLVDPTYQRQLARAIRSGVETFLDQ